MSAFSQTLLAAQTLQALSDVRTELSPLTDCFLVVVVSLETLTLRLRVQDIAAREQSGFDDLRHSQAVPAQSYLKYDSLSALAVEGLTASAWYPRCD